MITYNHEKYIAQAIEGVLMQQSNFPVELVIGDDASTDNTYKEIMHFSDKHPESIKQKRQSTNKGMIANFVDTLSRCDQKYIAFCEGDDYWMDPLKLQKQVDFMESNPDYVLCFHDSSVFDQDKQKKARERVVGSNEAYDLSVLDQIRSNKIPSQSLLFRNHIISEFPDWFAAREVGDYGLYFILQQYGKARYLPFVGSVYRRHQGGITFGHKVDTMKKLEMLKKKMISIDVYNEFLIYKFDKDFQESKKKIAQEVFLLAFKFRKFEDIKTLLKLNLVTYRSMPDGISMLKYIYAFVRTRFFYLNDTNLLF